jgi:4-aminobutyrate aminotransferase-like enzyme
MRLSALYKARFAETTRRTDEASGGISDLQFTEAYRVPFQYGAFLRQHLTFGAFVQSSAGVTVTDLDGNRFYDLTGSYGVNVFGYDFYKEAIAHGLERVRELGPVLGAYHPLIADNVRRLQEISGLDEVSFHMSGTEAVMQAVRLARYHTRRSHLVRFCGAYHGWWGDVQPGIGNRCRRARPTPSTTCPRIRCACCGRGATSRASSSIPCRPCIRTRGRPRTPRWSTARAARNSTRAPMPIGSGSCGPSAPSGTSS